VGVVGERAAGVICIVRGKKILVTLYRIAAQVYDDGTYLSTVRCL